MGIFINIFGATVIIAVVLFIVFLYKTIKIEDEKLKKCEINDVFDDAVEIAFRIVLNLNQTTVRKLKKDNIWNEELSKIIFEQGVQDLKYQLGDEKLKLLSKKVTDVNSYLNLLVESLVSEIKDSNIRNQVG